MQQEIAGQRRGRETRGERDRRREDVSNIISPSVSPSLLTFSHAHLPSFPSSFRCPHPIKRSTRRTSRDIEASLLRPFLSPWCHWSTLTRSAVAMFEILGSHLQCRAQHIHTHIPAPACRVGPGSAGRMKDSAEQSVAAVERGLQVESQSESEQPLSPAAVVASAGPGAGQQQDSCSSICSFSS